MFSKKWVLWCLTLLTLIFSISLGVGGSWAAEKKSLTWGTTGSASGLFPFFVISAKILNEKIPGINITVRSTGGVVHNARLLEKREIDVGAIDTKFAWEAIQGKGAFEGKPFPDADMRLLYVFMTNPFNFVVSEKSGVKTIYDLEGKLYCPGATGSSTETIGMDIFRILGVHPKIRRMGYADALEAVKNEQIVGWAKMGLPDAQILDAASAMKIRILSFTDAEIDKILKEVVGLRKTVVPAGMYPGVAEYKTVENEWSDFSRKDFPTDLAYQWPKTLWENRAEIKKGYPAIWTADRLVEISLAVKTPGIYLHPGAVKFYRELGMTVPKNLIPPEMGEK